MKISDISALYSTEMANLGMTFVQLATAGSQEVLLVWSKDLQTSHEFTITSKITCCFRSTKLGCSVGVYFSILGAEIAENAQIKKVDLFIHAGNWNQIWTQFSAEADFVLKAVANHKPWFDRFLEAAKTAARNFPLPDDDEIMGKPLWMWKPFSQSE